MHRPHSCSFNEFPTYPPITTLPLFPIFPLERIWFAIFCIVCANFAGCIPREASPSCCYMSVIQRDTTRTQRCRMSVELLNKVNKWNLQHSCASLCEKSKLGLILNIGKQANRGQGQCHNAAQKRKQPMNRKQQAAEAEILPALR